MEVETFMNLQMDEVPAPLQPLVKAVLGRWTGDIIELAGDYGEIAEKSAGDAGDEFTDISPNVAAAVFSVYHEYWYESHKSADDNIKNLKHKLPKLPDFDYCSVSEVKDKNFVRLIEMALKSAASSGNSGEDKKSVAGSGKSKKAAASSSAAAASPSDAASDGNRGIKRRKT